MNTLSRKFRSLLYHFRFKKEQLFDWLQGVDFAAPLTRTEAGVEDIVGSYPYCSTAYTPALSKTLDLLPITNQDAILDYGSGKGAMLLIFKHYPFRRIAGLEYSEKLVNISLNNFKKLKLHQLEVIQGDASSFKEIDDFNYFYFGNPFGSPVLEEVLKNIAVSWARRNRNIYLIYYHPLDKEPNINKKEFGVVRELRDGTRIFKIYTLLPAAVRNFVSTT